jgi:phosphoglycerate dehydrogenase-like enzyme
VKNTLFGFNVCHILRLIEFYLKQIFYRGINMRILLASKIYQQTVINLKQKHEIVYAFDSEEDELKKQIKDCEAVIFRSGINLSAAVMEGTSKLQLIIRAGSGFDNVDLDYIRKKGLKFVRIPKPGAKAVSEMAFGLMLGLARSIPQTDRDLHQGHWTKNEVIGYLLTQKTLGIVGTGNIGSRVGMLGSALGMKVLGCLKRPTTERRRKLNMQYGIQLVDFNDVISSADFVSIHVPLDESTRHLFDSSVFSNMKPGSFLINLSRGSVVDEHALCRALVKDKILRGAALDVHEREGEGQISVLAGLPNVILTPHIGAQTIDSQSEIGERIEMIIESYLTNQNRNPADRLPLEEIEMHANYSP